MLKGNSQSLNKIGDRTPTWKGSKAQYSALHQWIRRRKPKPEFCESCLTAKPYDLANISQEYKRDVDDFEWLCRKCHMYKDGRYLDIGRRNKGKPMLDEIKRKISATSIRKGIKPPNMKGIPKTEEHKRKLSEARKRWWDRWYNYEFETSFYKNRQNKNRI